METPAVTIQPVSQKKKSGLAPPPTPPPPPTKGQLSAPKPPPPPFTASTAQPCPPPPPKAKMSANKSQINNYNKHLEAVKKKVAPRRAAANTGLRQATGGGTSGCKTGPSNYDIKVGLHQCYQTELKQCLGIVEQESHTQEPRRQPGRLPWLGNRRTPIMKNMSTNTNNLQQHQNGKAPTMNGKCEQKRPIPQQNMTVLECKWELCKYFYPRT